jgi:hypothetical protein
VSDEDSTAPLRARAILLIACRRWLEQRDALAEVLRRLPEPQRGLLDKPPVRTDWLACEVFEEIYQTIAGLHGVEAVRELGHEATRDSLAGTILKPIIEVLVRLNMPPSGLFSRLNLSIRASMRGVTTDYRATDDTSGVLTARYAKPLPPMVQQCSLGALRYVYELCRVEGTVNLLSIEDDRRLARIAVAWQKRK